MTQQSNSSAFGQADPTDGRERFDWRSKYTDPIAVKKQRSEVVRQFEILALRAFLPAIQAPLKQPILMNSTSSFPTIEPTASALLCGLVVNGASVPSANIMPSRIKPI
jgi:hypothetical protein